MTGAKYSKMEKKCNENANEKRKQGKEQAQMRNGCKMIAKREKIDGRLNEMNGTTNRLHSFIHSEIQFHIRLDVTYIVVMVI